MKDDLKAKKVPYFTEKWLFFVLEMAFLDQILDVLLKSDLVQLIKKLVSDRKKSAVSEALHITLHHHVRRFHSVARICE